MKHLTVNVVLSCLVGSWIMAFVPTHTAEVTTEKLPEAIKREIDFDIDIDPIFQKHCYACHGDYRPLYKPSPVHDQVRI